jgi:hypothetical protein
MFAKSSMPSSRVTEIPSWDPALFRRLVVIAMKSFGGFPVYLHGVDVHGGLAAAVTAAAVLGSLAGVRLTGLIPEQALRKAFGWFVVAMSAFVLAQQLPGHVRANALLWTAVGIAAAATAAVTAIRARSRRRAAPAEPSAAPTLSPRGSPDAAD